MAGMFSSAARVVIGLGIEPNDSALAIETMDTLGSTLSVDWSKRTTTQSSEATGTDWSETSNDLPLAVETWESFQGLIKRP